jgi:hypothetical protein
LITGKSGSGKTTLYLATVVNYPARWKFIFDPDREFSRKCGVQSCYTKEQMEIAVSRRYPVAFCSAHYFEGRREEAFAFFVRWCLEVSKPLQGVKLLASDEVQKHTPEGGSTLPPAIADFLDTGRKEEIDSLFVTNAPNELHPAIRRQLTEIWAFQFSEPLCLEWLEARGFNPDEVKALPEIGVWQYRNLNTHQSSRGGHYNGSLDPQRKRNRRQAVAG